MGTAHILRKVLCIKRQRRWLGLRQSNPLVPKVHGMNSALGEEILSTFDRHNNDNDDDNDSNSDINTQA